MNASTYAAAIVYLPAAVIAIALSSACDGEPKQTAVTPPAAASVETVTMTELEAGPETQSATAPPALAEASDAVRAAYAYEPTAYDIAEGQRLYGHFNCVGCHANGGGGMGPPFMDEEWIYGSSPQQIFATIVQGRPEGMPSFRGRVPNNQVWQLVAYVRSLGGLTKTGSPGRSDHMSDTIPRGRE